MTSDDFLINHAYQHVWCAPEQDYQHIFRPARLSPPIGVRGSTDLIWSRYNLPTQGDWYHLYQIGPVMYDNLGLGIANLVWTSAGSQMVKQSMVIDVYTESGRMVPREHVYFLATPDGNLAIAVKDTKVIADFGAEPLYFRFYSNAFFNRLQEEDPQQGIEYNYSVPTTVDSISALARTFRDMVGRSGVTYAFINGWKVQSINVATVKRGDIVEMVRDSSIKEVHEFPVTDLDYFLSTLDSKQKYFLHRPMLDNDSIDYRDDVDIYLIKRTNENVYTGVYYHRNSEDSVRMVTHHDYSIPVPYVDRYTVTNAEWATTNQLIVQLVVREGGMDKPLLNEAHHIKELNKLSEQDYLQAVIGSDANVDVWKAASLESSSYTLIMRSVAGKITRKMVEDAYGYNAMGKLLADTPQRVVNVNRWVELPFGLRGKSTVYEYDRQGLLIDWYFNSNVQQYVARNEDCSYIEAITGQGSRRTNTAYGIDTAVTPGINYRCYICKISNAVPDGDWSDVTGNAELYSVVNNTVIWNVDRSRVYTAVKMDDSFLAYDLLLDYADGLLRFSLNVEEVRIDGNAYTGLNEIPVGVLELWLNGHPIIEGLDWFMNEKEICIVNKVWRNQESSENRITVRGTGFCNPDMSRIEQSEFGFVEQGWLSRNNRWNLRDDKVVRVTVGGRLFARDELNWTEDRPGLMLENVYNGAPYQVIEPVIPLRGATLEDTYALRDVARAVDKQIEDYMTMRMGEVIIDGPNLIPQPHELYSPFISKVMHDLDAGYIREEDISGLYSDMNVKAICQSYEWLLAYEPTLRLAESDYYIVHPHEIYGSVELGLYQYNFLRRVIRIYLEDKVNMSQFVSIKPLAN